MKAIKPSFTLLSFLACIFPRVTYGSFSLNVSGPDWDYTAADLANTTSQACKDAYSAPIDCDATLLGIVASMRPAFKTNSSNLASTCTSTCKASLDAYVKNVQAVCVGDGDKAQEDGGNTPMSLVSVDIVGQIFQYDYAKACRKDSSNNFCSLQELNYEFSCSDVCAISFFQLAHQYPASGHFFNYYWLGSTGSWWMNEFVSGWERIQQCEKAVGDFSTNSASANGPTSTTTLTPVVAATTTGIEDVSVATSAITLEASLVSTALKPSPTTSETSATATSSGSFGTQGSAGKSLAYTVLCIGMVFLSTFI